MKEVMKMEQNSKEENGQDKKVAGKLDEIKEYQNEN